MWKLRHTSARNSASVSTTPDQAQLLGQHREQEVGVRLGQVEELLHAESPRPTPNHCPRPIAISDCVS